MSSTWGESVKISIFGESHGGGIGVVLDGLPAGEPVDWDAVLRQMRRRAPGQNLLATQRRETDEPEILSGLYNGRTTGTPLCAVIKNADTRSGDYAGFDRVPRPGHADYTGVVRYSGFNDPRGGGHFSGRLTAPMVFAGAVCRQILERKGVVIAAHLLQVGGAADTAFDPAGVSGAELRALLQKEFPAIDDGAGEKMKEEINKARIDLDSVGGVVECAVTGLPAGLGDPIFGGVENRLASILFGIPAVKGLEFGAGFAAAGMKGSENNDPFCIKDGRVCTVTNNHGGILGGITSAMPLVFRLAFKPTPSISRPQQSVDLLEKKETTLEIHGRHDPCVAVRAVPVAESLAAVCLLDLILSDGGCSPKKM